jgi:hypothetical protein
VERSTLRDIATPSLKLRYGPQLQATFSTQPHVIQCGGTIETFPRTPNIHPRLISCPVLLVRRAGLFILSYFIHSRRHRGSGVEPEVIMPLTKSAASPASRGSPAPRENRHSGSGFHPFGGRVSKHFGDTVSSYTLQVFAISTRYFTSLQPTDVRLRIQC